MIVTLTPNPSVDVKMIVRDPRLTELNRARRVFLEASGKGINVSRALAALGIGSAAVAPLGGPFGSWIGRALSGAAFELVRVPIAGETRANTKVIDQESGALTEFNAPGPRLDPVEWAALEAAVLGRAGAGDVAVLSGSLPPGTSPSRYAALLERLRDAGALTVLDAHGAALDAALPGRPDVIKPNLREAAEAVRRDLATLGDALAAADELRARGAGLVVLTLGRAGALLAARDAALLAVPPELAARNVNGAGDALIAGLIAAWSAPAGAGHAEDRSEDGTEGRSEDRTEPPGGRRGLLELARRAVAAGSARAAAPGGAFGSAREVVRLESRVAAATLERSAAASWSGLRLNALTTASVRTIADAARTAGRKGSP